MDVKKARLHTLIKETLALLCRNGLEFALSCNVEALIGITLDEKDVMLVNINEKIEAPTRKTERKRTQSVESISDDESPTSSKRSKINSSRNERQCVLNQTENIQPNNEEENESCLAVKQEPIEVSSQTVDDQAHEKVKSQSESTKPSGIKYEAQSTSNWTPQVLSQPVFPSPPPLYYFLPKNEESMSQPASETTSNKSLEGGGQLSDMQATSLYKSPAKSGQPLICSFCMQEFKFSQSYRDHLRNRHNIGEPFVCQCGLKVMDRRKFAQHKRACQPGLEGQILNTSNDSKSDLPSTCNDDNT